MPTFYYAPHTCALASHIAFEEAGGAYDIVRVNLATREQRSADYLAINPKAEIMACRPETHPPTGASS